VTAVFHHLAPKAKVVGIEHIKELAEWSEENLRRDGVTLGEGGVEIIHRDGRLGELPETHLCSEADTQDHRVMVGGLSDRAQESSVPDNTRWSSGTDYTGTLDRSGKLYASTRLSII